MFKDDRILAFSFVAAPVFAAIFGFWLFKKRSSIRFAQFFLGQEEKAGNAGFMDEVFENQMKSIAGFKDFQQWCAYFVRFVMLSKTKPVYHDYLEKLLSPSTQLMWRNAINDETGNVSTHDNPRVGDIVIWQSYRDSSKGHTGIVIKVNTSTFETIEGNVNSYSGKTSEGIVARKTHDFDGDGMTLLGFIRLDRKLFKIF